MYMLKNLSISFTGKSSTCIKTTSRITHNLFSLRISRCWLQLAAKVETPTMMSRTPAPPKSSPMATRSGGRGSRTVDAASRRLLPPSPYSSPPMTPGQLRSLSPVSDLLSQKSPPVPPFPRASQWQWGNQEEPPKRAPQHHRRHSIKRGHSGITTWESVCASVDSALGKIDPAVFHVKKLAELGKQRFEAAHNKTHPMHHVDHHGDHHGGGHLYHSGQHPHHSGHHPHHSGHHHSSATGHKKSARKSTLHSFSSHGRGTPSSSRSRQSLGHSSRRSSKLRQGDTTRNMDSRQSLLTDDASLSKPENHGTAAADGTSTGQRGGRGQSSPSLDDERGEAVSMTPDRMTPDIGTENQHQMETFGLLLPAQKLYEGQLALSEYFRKYRKTKLDSSGGEQRIGPSTARDNYLSACASQNAAPEPLGIVRRRAKYHGQRSKAVDLSFFGVGKKASRRLAGPLGQLNFVDSLCLRGNRLSDAGTIHIVSGLGRWVCHLDLANNNIGSKGAASLQMALVHTGCVIQTLCLEKNRLKDRGTILIAESLKRNRSLKRLSLRGNDIGSDGCRALAFGLCPALETWSVSTVIDSSVVQNASESAESNTSADKNVDKNVTESNDVLEELDLSWNRITGDGAMLLCCALMSPMFWDPTEDVDEEENNESSNSWEGVAHPAALVDPCEVQDLDLSWNLIGHSRTAVGALARMLRHNTSLLRLDVGYNWFDPDYPGNIGVVEKPRESLEMLRQGLAYNQSLLDFFIEGTSAIINPQGYMSLREQKLEDVIENSIAQRVAHIMPPSNSNSSWIDMNVTLDRRDHRWDASNNPGWIAGGWSEVTIEWSAGNSVDSSKFDNIEIDMRLSLDNFKPTRMTKSRAGQDIGILGGNWIFTSTRVIPPGDLLYFFTVVGELENEDMEKDEEEEDSSTDDSSSCDESSEIENHGARLNKKTTTSSSSSSSNRIRAFIAKDQPKVSHNVTFEPPVPLPMNRANYVFVQDRVGPLLLVKVQPRRPLDEPITDEIHMNAWRLSRSVFAPRERTSDGRSFFDDDAVYARACSADLSQCRFERLLGPIELEALEEAILPRYEFLTKYIRVQMCRSGSPHLFSYADLESWATDCSDLLDTNYSFEDIADTWNYVKQTSISATAEPDVMTRAEFLELLVRVSISKHAPQYETSGGKFGYKGDSHVAGDAFDILCDVQLEIRIGDLRLPDPHEFRIRELYKPQLDLVLRRRLDILKLGFASWARDLHTALTYEEYHDMFIQPATMSGKLQLSEESTRTAFGLAKMTSVDEKVIMLSDGHSHFSLQFTDFLECIARLAKDNHLVSKNAEIQAQKEERAKKKNESSPLYRSMMYGDGENSDSDSQDDEIATTLVPLDQIVAEFIDDVIRPLINVTTTLRRASVQDRLSHIDRSQNWGKSRLSGMHGKSGEAGHNDNPPKEFKATRGERRQRASMDIIAQYGAKSARMLCCTGISMIENLDKDIVLEEGTAQWSLPVSVFKNRQVESDAQDFYDNATVFDRAFQYDFANLLSKERFTNMINLYDDEGGTEEIDEVREALFNCYGTLTDAFEFYSVMGKGFVQSHVIDIVAFSQFVKDCDIADTNTCKEQDTVNAFEFENAEEVSSDGSNGMNDMNDDSALMRFEFLGCVVRLAIIKYVKSGMVFDVSEAVQLLCEKNIQKHLGPQAICDSNDFRRYRLYNPKVDHILCEHLHMLRGIFDAFASPIEHKGGSTRMRMGISGWGQFVTAAGLMGDDFDEKEAKLAFAWCQMAVSNEVQPRSVFISISFEDFLEALARICDLKALPTVLELRAAGTKNTAHFFNILEEEGTLPDFYETHPTEWNDVKKRAVADLLPQLLDIVYYWLENNNVVLDVNNNVVLDVRGKGDMNSPQQKK